MKKIESEADYQDALERLDELWNRGMSNSLEFDRLEKSVLEYEDRIAGQTRLHEIAECN